MNSRKYAILMILALLLLFPFVFGRVSSSVEDFERSEVDNLKKKEQHLVLNMNDGLWGSTDETVIISEDGSGEIMPPLIREYEPYFDANVTISKGLLFDITTKINEADLSKENARIIMVKLMTLQQFVQDVTGEDVSSYPQISPNRLLWIVRIHYPEGYYTRPGLIENAVVTGIYDAETGIYLGSHAVSKNY